MATKNKTTTKKESKKKSSSTKKEPKGKESTTSKTKSSKKEPTSKSKSQKKSSEKKTKKGIPTANKVAMAEANDKLGALAMFLEGQTLLEEQRKELEEMKKEAKELQKDKMRSSIKEGDIELKDTSGYSPDEITATAGARKVVQKIDLYKWTAPIRVTFPFDEKLFISIVILSLVFILYLAVLGHYALMFVILALLFLIYVAGTTDPIDVTHTITTRGIDSMDELFEWYHLREFWFTKKNDQFMLIVDTRKKSPAQLIMLLDEKDITPVFILLQDKLLYKDIRKQGRISKITYGEYIPIDKV